MASTPAMTAMIGFVLIFFSFGGASTWIARRNRKISLRLERLAGQASDEPEEEAVTVEPRRNVLHATIAVIGEKFRGKSYVNRWENQLEQAALPLRPEEFFGLRILTTFGMAIAAIVLGMANHGIVLLFACLVGYALPGIYLKRRIAKRLDHCGVQLPSALGTMATAMRAGFSFLQAMKLVGQELSDPLGPEFTKVLREMNLGLPVEDALNRLLQRLPDADLELVVTALMIQRSTGGNLAEILESIQETIQERIRIKEELKTLTAQGRMSAWIISLLPLILGLILNVMNHAYFVPLIAQPLGWAFLAVGTISGLLGWFAIRKIVQIEV